MSGTSLSSRLSATWCRYLSSLTPSTHKGLVRCSSSFCISFVTTLSSTGPWDRPRKDSKFDGNGRQSCTREDTTSVPLISVATFLLTLACLSNLFTFSLQSVFNVHTGSAMWLTRTEGTEGTEEGVKTETVGTLTSWSRRRRQVLDFSPSCFRNTPR